MPFACSALLKVDGVHMSFELLRILRAADPFKIYQFQYAGEELMIRSAVSAPAAWMEEKKI